MTDHPFNNDTDQETRRQVERDSYLSRAQADADLTSQGRFKRETTTRVTGVPVYPSLPPSSPWASGFDQNVEPTLGVDINEMPANGTPVEVQASLDAAAARTEAGTPPTSSVEQPAVSIPPESGLRSLRLRLPRGSTQTFLRKESKPSNRQSMAGRRNGRAGVKSIIASEAQQVRFQL